MTDLAHNHVFVKNHEAWYRDFEREISARDIIREMCKHYEIECPADNEEFDEYMFDLLQDGYETLEGMIAMYYNTMWGFAEVREVLKECEDLEEQGLLKRLPCKVGDTVYCTSHFISGTIESTITEIMLDGQGYKIRIINGRIFSDNEFNKKWFITQEKAGKTLKGAKNES